MVHFNPEERPNISEILENSWLFFWFSLQNLTPPHLYLKIDILYFLFQHSYFF